MLNSGPIFNATIKFLSRVTRVQRTSSVIIGIEFPIKILFIPVPARYTRRPPQSALPINRSTLFLTEGLTTCCWNCETFTSSVLFVGCARWKGKRVEGKTTLLYRFIVCEFVMNLDIRILHLLFINRRIRRVIVRVKGEIFILRGLSNRS